jgi:hypothetical protein
MQPDDIKISRHEDPDIVKVEFVVGDEDAVVISMRGDGVQDLNDDQAVGRARRVMERVLGGSFEGLGDRDDAGLDQTLASP